MISLTTISISLIMEVREKTHKKLEIIFEIFKLLNFGFISKCSISFETFSYKKRKR